MSHEFSYFLFDVWGALEAYADLQDRQGAGYIWAPKPVNRTKAITS